MPRTPKLTDASAPAETIAVRMTFVVTVPRTWEVASAAPVEELPDADQLAQGLVATGMSEEAAADAARLLLAARAASAAKGSGANDIRADVREYVLGEVAGLDKIRAFNGAVEDATRSRAK